MAWSYPQNMGTTTNIKETSGLICDLLKNDNYCLVGIGGFPGKGKSTLAIQLQMEVSRIMGQKWNFRDNCTWSRKEFLNWIQGSKDGKVEKKPEYSSLLPDELFSMFYKRNWNQDTQKEGISLLNMCRDRHLFICGNVPNFWDLDGGFLSRVMYYIFIPERGRAWIFEQENNPFSADLWNVNENKRKFRKAGFKPYRLPNFVAELRYPDLPQDLKERYLNIRNRKRIQAQDDVRKETVEKYSKIKKDRDNLIRAMNLKYGIKQKDIKGHVSLKSSMISDICLGVS